MIPCPQVFANHLPGSWTITDNTKAGPTSLTVTRSDGLALWLRHDAPSGRIAISLSEIPINHGDPRGLCVWPHEVRDHTTREKLGATPRITVAPGTTSEALAKHVTRRLLPTAERFHAAMLAEREQIRATQNKRAAAVALLKSAGVRFGDGTNGARADKIGSVYPDVPGHLVVNDYGGVRFDRLDVTAEQAVAIVNALRAVPA